jgi:hypothetical protein
MDVCRQSMAPALFEKAEFHFWLADPSCRDSSRSVPHLATVAAEICGVERVLILPTRGDPPKLLE